MADPVDTAIQALIHAYENYTAVADMRPPEDPATVAAKALCTAAKAALIASVLAEDRQRRAAQR